MTDETKGLEAELEQMYRALAQSVYAQDSEDDIEVDEDAIVSIRENGAWVQAWIWVPEYCLPREP